jgi:hypothetical protein
MRLYMVQPNSGLLDTTSNAGVLKQCNLNSWAKNNSKERLQQQNDASIAGMSATHGNSRKKC